jgi:uncharacterized membrane protein
LGNDGTGYGGVDCGTDVEGKFGGACDFDGVDDYVVIASNFSLTNVDVTIANWVYIESLSKRGAFVKVGGEIGSDGYALGVGGTTFDNNGNDLILLYESVRWIDTNSVIGTGWHHTVMVIDSSGVPEGFIDGVSVGSFSGTNALSPSDETMIGGYNESGNDRFFNGTIDEVAIFNRSLSAAEIRNQYVSGWANVTLQVRSCGRSDCLDSGFVGPDGLGSSYFTTQTLNTENLTHGRYFQYRLFLQTNNTDVTPVVESVNVTAAGLNWSSWVDVTNGTDINHKDRNVQYRAFLNTTDSVQTPQLRWIKVRYTNYTDVQGAYSYDFGNDWAGYYILWSNLTNEDGVSFLNSTSYEVWVPTTLNYSVTETWATYGWFNVTVNYTKTGNLSVLVYNNTASVEKSCIGYSCTNVFVIGLELEGANYTINITGTNETAFYRNATMSFQRWLYEATTVGEVSTGRKIIADMIGGVDYSYLWNVTLNNTARAPMYNASIGINTIASDIDDVVPINNCSAVIYPGETCTREFNITVAGTYEPDTYRMSWWGNWTEQNGDVGEDTFFDISAITILGNPIMNVTVTLINVTENISQSYIQIIYVNSTGNEDLDDVTVSYTGTGDNPMPSSWIDFYSPDVGWDDDANQWVSIPDGSYKRLRVNITVLDYTEGTFTGRISITTLEGLQHDINVSVLIDANLDVTPLILTDSVQQGIRINRTFIINSTGNAPLQSLNITWINDTMPIEWVGINQSFYGNLSEREVINVSVNITVPMHYTPGLYNGTINVSTVNTGSKLILVNTTVPVNGSWIYAPDYNLTNSFVLQEAGIVGVVYINNTGNVPLNFTVAYDDWNTTDYHAFGDLIFEEDYNGYNPTSLYIEKNSTGNITIYQKSYDQGLSGIGIKISILNTTAEPATKDFWMSFDIVDQPPSVEKIWFVLGQEQNYTEIYKNTTIWMQVIDDAGIDTDSARLNITGPSGSEILLPGITSQYRTYKGSYIEMNFTTSDIFTIVGNYTVFMTVNDTTGNNRTSDTWVLEVLGATTMSLTASGISVDDVFHDSGVAASVPVLVNNTGLVRAYNLTVYGVVDGWDVVNVTIDGLNGSSSTSVQINVSVPANSLGGYTFTPIVNWTDPDGDTRSSTDDSATINVLSNPDFELLPSAQNIEVPHGQKGSLSFMVNVTGNDNVSSFSITNLSTSSALNITYIPTGGSADWGMLVNVTVNISVDSGADAATASDPRQFTTRVIGGGHTHTYITNVTTPQNTSWEISNRNITINKINGVTETAGIVNITHLGTGDVTLAFSMGLGNLSFATLANTSLTLSALQTEPVYISYTTPDETATYIGNLSINETNYGVKDSVKITFNVRRMQLKVMEYAPTQVYAGDTLNITVNLTYGNEYVSGNTTYSVDVEGETCIVVYNATSANVTTIRCILPDVLDAQYHNFTVTSVYTSPDIGEITVTNTTKNALYYVDVSLPIFSNENSPDIELGNDQTINITVTDNLGVDRVWARIVAPNGTQWYNLSQADSLWAVTIGSGNITTIGYYNITYYANDSTGNQNTTTGQFEVYEIKNFSGWVKDLKNESIRTTFEVFDSGTLIHNFTTNASGYYSQSIKRRPYQLIIHFMNVTIDVFSIDFAELPTDFLDLDRVSTTDVDLTNPVSGFAIRASFPVSGNITIYYKDTDVSVSEEYLEMYRCLNWTYETRTCEENWWVSLPAKVNKIYNYIVAPVSIISDNGTSHMIAETIPVPEPVLYIPNPAMTVYVNQSSTVTEELEVRSTGNSPVTNVHFTCSSGAACNNLTVVGPTISSIPVGYIQNVPINFTAPAGLTPTVYTGTLLVVSDTTSEEVALTVVVPEDKNWSALPSNFNITTGSGTRSSKTVNISNKGNVDISFTFDVSDPYLSTSLSATTISKQSSKLLTINYMAPSQEGTYDSNLSIRSSGTPAERNISFHLIVDRRAEITFVNPSTDILANMTLQIYAKAYYQGVEQKNGVQWLASVAGDTCSLLNYSYTGNYWDMTCKAPNVTAASIAKELRLTALFTNYSVMAYDNATIYYLDVTAPRVSNYTKEIEGVGNYTINVTVFDETNISGVNVTVNFPSGKTEFYNLTKNGSVYQFATNFSEIGDYTFLFGLTDTLGNSGTESKIFEIYTVLNFSGDVVAANGTATATMFRLYRPGAGLMHTFNTSADGSYSVLIHNRTYDLRLYTLGNDWQIFIPDVDFSLLSQDVIDMGEVDTKKVGVANARDIEGLAVNTSITGSGNIIVHYDSDNVDNIKNVYVYSCANWNFTGDVCDDNEWSQLSGHEQVDGYVTASFTNFNTMLLSEVTLTIPPGTTIYSTKVTETFIGGGGGVGRRVDLTGIEKKLEEIQKSVTDIAGVDVSTRLIEKQLYPGETASSKIHLRNKLNRIAGVTTLVYGDIKDMVFIENPIINLEPGQEDDIIVKMFVPFGKPAGNYEGELQISHANENATIPVTIRVLKIEEKLLDIKIHPITPVITPGKEIKSQIDLYNLGKDKKVDVQLNIQLIEPKTEEIIIMTEEALAVETTLSLVRKINTTEDTKVGRYILKATAYYSNANRTMQATSLAYVSIEWPWWMIPIFGVRVWEIMIAIFIGFGLFAALAFYKYQQEKKKRYIGKVDIKTLPQPGPGAAFVGKLAETDIRTFFDLNKLQMHTLVAGATGSGKTITAQDIAEEALKKNASVIVFDPTAQWTGFFKKCEDKMMLKRYRYFEMKHSDAQAFKGRIHIVKDPREVIDITKNMTPGEITIYAVHKLTPQQIDILVSSSIQQVFKANLEESPKLKTLIVYDEVHRLLPKFGGSGAGFIQLERGAREFRKWGIGLLLISQVLSDFVGEIKANIGTEVQMRTRYEADLNRIKMKYGEDILKSVVRESIGTGMTVNAEFNNGRPYFVAYRPILHHTRRLTNTELKKYEKYNSKVLDLEYQIEQLKKLKQDVFDLEMELKLAQDKLVSGTFNMVDIYMESLKPRIDALFKKLGKRPEKRKIKLMSEEEIKEGIQRAKQEREKITKKLGGKKGKELVERTEEQKAADVLEKRLDGVRPYFKNGEAKKVLAKLEEKLKEVKTSGNMDDINELAGELDKIEKVVKSKK